MAKNRKNQTAAIRFGPALKASFLILLIGGSAIGYVWQKSEISRLDRQMVAREKALDQLTRDNQTLVRQLSTLHSPVMLDQRARELKLGLAPAQPGQVISVAEPVSAPSEKRFQSRQFAQRPAIAMTP